MLRSFHPLAMPTAIVTAVIDSSPNEANILNDFTELSLFYCRRYFCFHELFLIDRIQMSRENKSVS